MEECLQPDIARRIDNQHNQHYHREVESLFKKLDWFVKYFTERIDRVSETDIDRRIVHYPPYSSTQLWKIDVSIPLKSKRIVNKLNDIMDVYTEIQALDAQARTERASLVDAFIDKLTTALRKGFLTDKFVIRNFTISVTEYETSIWKRLFMTDAVLVADIILAENTPPVDEEEEDCIDIEDDISFDPANDTTFVTESISRAKVKHARGKKAYKAKKAAKEAAKQEIASKTDVSLDEQDQLADITETLETILSRMTV